jgi:hypothetical protein
MQRGQSMAGPAALIRAVAVRPVLPLDARPDRAFCLRRVAYLAAHRHRPSHLDRDYLRKNETRRSRDSSPVRFAYFAGHSAPQQHRMSHRSANRLTRNETRRSWDSLRRPPAPDRTLPDGQAGRERKRCAARRQVDTNFLQAVPARWDLPVGTCQVARWNLPVGTCQLELAIFEQSPWLVARTVVRGVESIGFTSRRPPGAAIRLQDSNRACSYRRSSRLSPPPFRSTHSQA